MSAAPDEPLKRTPLYDLHVALGAKMVPFAGYAMPVQYPLGILKEHLHTRAEAGLFDVSHMGQAYLDGPDHATTARALEALVPADIAGLMPGQQRYSQLLNDEGGIIDDLMVSFPARPARRPADAGRQCRAQGRRLRPYRSAPAGQRQADAAYRPRAAGLPGAGRRVSDGEALGRCCQASVHARWQREGRRLRLPGFAFGLHRRGRLRDFGGVGSGDRPCQALWVIRRCSRSASARATPGLEAGLCLYGHDIDETTSPIEAGLAWSIQKRRRTKAASPASNASATSWLAEQPASGSASSRRDGRQRVRAPKFNPRRANASASSRRAVSGRASTRLSPWATCSPATRHPARRST